MKKVRFESPIQVFNKQMDDLECHSPRPFIEKHVVNKQPDFGNGYPKLLPYSPDPILRYEHSNQSPYPVVRKTLIGESDSGYLPSNDLDLSMLDGSSHEPRKSIFHTKDFFTCKENGQVFCGRNPKLIPRNSQAKVLTSVENTKPLNEFDNKFRNNSFFISPDNLKQLNAQNEYPLQNQLHRLSINKENVSLAKQAEMTRLTLENIHNIDDVQLLQTQPVIPVECQCHHCIKLTQTAPPMTNNFKGQSQSANHLCNVKHQQCEYLIPHHGKCNRCVEFDPLPVIYKCENKHCSAAPVDKRTWMVNKYEQCNKTDALEVERQNNIKEIREPTVADLFKIIKLQNEQLQLLQEKVDKFISNSNSNNVNGPMQKFVTEHVALESVGNEQHKISIGVMTSFEMVRTSTVINKEIVTQTNESGHIQCNRSQISIKEVVSKSQGNSNFLDGITPVGQAESVRDIDNIGNDEQKTNADGLISHIENINDDKTFNELSLYNVQVDNAITPLISPEQSLYLDVRDYSDSDSDSDGQSNVGWTYYNKVMTHVNGMLQDSDMPSSASAMYKNTREQCVQMQIDKTNVSVTKRVKFGDDPLGIRQQHIYTPSTDTSLKMNQLAAKYLKSVTPTPSYQVPISKPAVPIDMSFATRNYMERHKILQGGNTFPLQQLPAVEMPRFLDITALKQQPKFL